MTDTRLVTIKDREVEVSPLNDTQYMLMGREMMRVKRVIDKNEVGTEQVPGLLRSMGFVLDIIETRVVSEDDRDYLTDLMARGELEFADLMPLIRAFSDDEAKPAVSRGRSQRKR